MQASLFRALFGYFNVRVATCQVPRRFLTVSSPAFFPVHEDAEESRRRRRSLAFQMPQERLRIAGKARQSIRP